MKKVLRASVFGKESLILDAHDEKAEAEVDQVKRAYSALTKALDEAHPHNTDPSKQLKRVSQHVVGSKMMSAARENFEDTSSGFGKLYQSCARIQLDLGQMMANHHHTVHDKVVDKLNISLESSTADVATARKKVTTCTQNFESTKKKYEQAKTKLEQKGGEELQQKCDLSKTAFDDSVKELSKAQTGYSVALRSFLDQDRQLGAPLVDLVTEQINFHRTSLMILEQMMPKLESVYHEMGTSEGLEEEGIFRRAGAASQIRKLREGFSKGSADLSSPANYGGDIHAVAAIIKAYFRELHEPLLITTFFNSWVEAVQIVDHNEKLYAMQTLATSMPRGHYDTLRFLSKFCCNVAKGADKNKMNLNNLALVFGPNMLWQAGQIPGELGDDSQSITVAAEMLFTYADWFFPPEENEINAVAATVEEMMRPTTGAATAAPSGAAAATPVTVDTPNDGADPLKAEQNAPLPTGTTPPPASLVSSSSDASRPARPDDATGGATKINRPARPTAKTKPVAPTRPKSVATPE